MHLTATVSDISRCSVHDGPGVRTVVYFQGCSLRCAWCHNPETLTGSLTLMYLDGKCIGCGRCAEVCPVHGSLNGTHTVSRERCRGCGKCVDVCPSGALRLCFDRVSAEELLGRILKDKPYFDASGGGVTLSGGECLLQSEFCAELLRLCRERGISTAIESALFVPYENVERVLPYVDLFFADLKIATPALHERWTGQDNARILENLARLSRSHVPLVIRIPVIPTVNDTEEELCAIAEVLSGLGESVREVELLRYNPLAEGKYRAVGRKYSAFADAPQTDGEMQMLCDRLSALIREKYPIAFRK